MKACSFILVYTLIINDYNDSKVMIIPQLLIFAAEFVQLVLRFVMVTPIWLPLASIHYPVFPC